MASVSFLIRRALRMDWKAMWRTADMLHEKTGKGRVSLMADMAECARRYGAGYVDYKIAEMYRLTPEQRATVITRGVSNAIEIGRAHV